MEAHPVADPARDPVVDTYVDRGLAAYLAELFGTFALVFFIRNPVTPRTPKWLCIMASAAAPS